MKSFNLRALFENCKIYLLGIFIFFFQISFGFSEISGCRNPTEITLKEDITMKFCEIPAGSAYLNN